MPPEVPAKPVETPSKSAAKTSPPQPTLSPSASPMSDLRRISLAAIVFLVLLRMAIGWQFFYEGVWKLQTLSTANKWTAAGYLKAAQGPFRNVFRGMVDDPDDLDKLDYNKVTARWNEWKALFLAHHPDLSEKQKQQLDKTMAGLQTRLKEQLESPEWAGVIRARHKGTSDEKSIGEIELYKNMLARYEANRAKAETNFQLEHLDKQWKEIQDKRKMLAEPIDALTAELHAAPTKILTLDQLSAGPSPLPPSKIDSIDQQTIWGLIIIGFLLIAGLFSRLAAAGAAVMLLMFYLVTPPWPGVPEGPGPEHSLIVNKNFIEILACLALVALPSGRWLGLDAWVRRFILRRTTD